MSDGDQPMADKPDGKWFGRWLTPPWTAMVVLVLYPLSMGPVWWLSDRFDLWTGIATGPQFIFYAPVIWICGTCPLLAEALHWYVGLWANIAA
jgi:hypothetical protein